MNATLLFKTTSDYYVNLNFADSEMLTQVVVQIKALKDLLNNYKVSSISSK